MISLHNFIKISRNKYSDTNIYSFKLNNPDTWGLYYQTIFGPYLICSIPARGLRNTVDKEYYDTHYFAQEKVKVPHRTLQSAEALLDDFMKHKNQRIHARYEEDFGDPGEQDHLDSIKVEEERTRIGKYLDSEFKHKSQSKKESLKKEIYAKQKVK